MNISSCDLKWLGVGAVFAACFVAEAVPKGGAAMLVTAGIIATAFVISSWTEIKRRKK
jgi:hypothetical protein